MGKRALAAVLFVSTGLAFSPGARAAGAQDPVTPESVAQKSYWDNKIPGGVETLLQSMQKIKAERGASAEKFANDVVELEKLMQEQLSHRDNTFSVDGNGNELKQSFREAQAKLIDQKNQLYRTLGILRASGATKAEQDKVMADLALQENALKNQYQQIAEDSANVMSAQKKIQEAQTKMEAVKAASPTFVSLLPADMKTFNAEKFKEAAIKQAHLEDLENVTNQVREKIKNDNEGMKLLFSDLEHLKSESKLGEEEMKIIKTVAKEHFQKTVLGDTVNQAVTDAMLRTCGSPEYVQACGKNSLSAMSDAVKQISPAAKPPTGEKSSDRTEATAKENSPPESGTDPDKDSKAPPSSKTTQGN